MTPDSRLPTPDSPVVAILLAAGRSSRMGAFKPLLPFGDKTVIEHCLANLRGGGVQSTVVVVGHHADELRRHLGSADVMFAVNPDPNSEMSASIAIGLRQIPSQARAVMILPVDHPAVSSEVVALLVREWEQGAAIVVPTWNNRGGHPVLVDLSFREELLNLDAERGLRGLFEVHKSRLKRVPVESPYIARDIDTWDDYLALHEEVFGVRPQKPPSSQG